MTSVALTQISDNLSHMTTDGDINGEAVVESTVDSQRLDIHQNFIHVWATLNIMSQNQPLQKHEL